MFCSFSRAILEDHDKVKRPELSCFTSFTDAINRLLPYHVYQYREKDLRFNLEHFQRDGLYSLEGDLLLL